MERKKLSFSTHEVNDLIGGVPRKILVYCLCILLVTVICTGLMITITPYPQNVAVTAKILPSTGNGKMVCRLYFSKTSFNESYLTKIKAITINISGLSEKYQLKASVQQVFSAANGLTAEAVLADDIHLKEFIRSEGRLALKPLTAEVSNPHFTVKDKLASNFKIY